MKMVLSRLFFLMVVFGSALPAVAEDTWPSWRGPRGDGSRPDKVVPLKWSVEKNTVWKTPLPLRGGAHHFFFSVSSRTRFFSISSASTDPERSGSIFSIVLPALHTTSAASTPPRACPGQA